MRHYEIHLKLKPQKKWHTRCIRLIYVVEVEHFKECRNEAINKAYQEGYNLNGYKIERIIKLEEG